MYIQEVIVSLESIICEGIILKHYGLRIMCGKAVHAVAVKLTNGLDQVSKKEYREDREHRRCKQCARSKHLHEDMEGT